MGNICGFLFSKNTSSKLSMSKQNNNKYSLNNQKQKEEEEQLKNNHNISSKNKLNEDNSPALHPSNNTPNINNNNENNFVSNSGNPSKPYTPQPQQQIELQGTTYCSQINKKIEKKAKDHIPKITLNSFKILGDKIGRGHFANVYVVIKVDDNNLLKNEQYDPNSNLNKTNNINNSAKIDEKDGGETDDANNNNNAIVSSSNHCSNDLLSLAKAKKSNESINNNIINSNYSQNPQLYAMKAIKKCDLLKQKHVDRALLERNILMQGRAHNSPFLLELKYSFQNENWAFYITEFVPCGDLSKLLQKLQKFNDEQAAFVTAELILGLEYLHNHLKIIYRDLKPENALITSEGHIKIADFGISKQFQNDSDISTTFIGTPNYIAPEIIRGQGYDRKVDLWSLGIFLFKLLSGKTPFRDKNKNKKNIYDLILKNQPEYPKYFSRYSVDLIQKLLVNDPLQRLGASDFQELKSHPYFFQINWNLLASLKVQSPLKPHLIFTQIDTNPMEAEAQFNQIENEGQNAAGNSKIQDKKQSNLKLIKGFSYSQDFSNNTNAQQQQQQQ